MEYLVGSLELLAVWTLLLVLRRDLKQEMVLMSSLSAVFALLDPLFMPAYWNPVSIWRLHFVGWFCDLESIIYCFATGGIAFSIYKVIANQRIEKDGSRRPSTPMVHALMNLVGLVGSLGIAYYAFQKWMPTFIVTLLIGSGIIVYRRSDLLRPLAWSGCTFLVIHTFVLITLDNLLFPGCIARFWNVHAIVGVYFVGVPLEEMLFSLAFGMTVSVTYEYILGYELKKKNLLHSEGEDHK